MCSKQTSWAKRGQFPVCPKHYYSSQRVLKSITSKEMVSPAEFSKSSFFTAINSSSSNSSESKGDGERCSQQRMAGALQAPKSQMFPRTPLSHLQLALCGWFSAGQTDFLQPLCRQGSLRHSSWVCFPDRLAESPGTSGNPGGWRRYSYFSLSLAKKYSWLTFLNPNWIINRRYT